MSEIGPMEKTYCKYCNQELVGRKGKMFCDNFCKSAQQYKDKKENEKLYFSIAAKLRNNRKILKKLNGSGLAICNKEVMLEDGFDPRYFTHYWRNKKGVTYFFCYEYGYRYVEKDGKEKYILIQWQDYMKPSPYLAV